MRFLIVLSEVKVWIGTRARMWSLCLRTECFVAMQLQFNIARFFSTLHVPRQDCAMPRAGFTKMSTEEIRLAKQWYAEGVGPPEIASRLGRDRTTMTRLLVQQIARRPLGRRAALTKAKIDFLVRRLDELVRRSQNRYTVTVSMLKRSTRVKASERTISNALHDRKIFFRKLREKPVLTEADIEERYEFAKKYRNRSTTWWLQNMHAGIDGKFFKVYLTGAARLVAARHATYGAYRSPGQGLDGAYVKPQKRVKYNTGAPSSLIVAAVGAGRMLMWHDVPRGRWHGQAAADMYKGPLHKSLIKAWGNKRHFNVLEDNDPTGFKSGKGIRAKAEARIKPFAIPRRSPDLSVCDYAIWKEVNTRMRKQELSWRKSKRESKMDYMARLHRTALRLPRSFMNKSIGDMKRRCERLYEAGGGLFEEGGR